MSCVDLGVSGPVLKCVMCGSGGQWSCAEMCNVWIWGGSGNSGPVLRVSV